LPRRKIRSVSAIRRPAEHEGHGELGRRVGQDAWRIRRAQAARTDGIDVDVVEADGEVRDDLERVAGCDELVVADRDGRICHDRTGAGEVLEQPGAVVGKAADLYLEAFRELVQPRGWEGARDDDLHAIPACLFRSMRRQLASRSMGWQLIGHPSNATPAGPAAGRAS
jgi:hypothetical protein